MNLSIAQSGMLLEVAIYNGYSKWATNRWQTEYVHIEADMNDGIRIRLLRIDRGLARLSFWLLNFSLNTEPNINITTRSN